jgi:hypothetical protein
MSAPDDGMTFLFSPQYEEATVSILWKQPERIAAFLRDFDPAVHLVQLHLRIILEAVNLSYGDHGEADWASVVQVIQEIGKLDEVGGLEGLNRVYSAKEITPVTDKIYAHYLEALQTYAAHRSIEPFAPVIWPRKRVQAVAQFWLLFR